MFLASLAVWCVVAVPPRVAFAVRSCPPRLVAAVVGILVAVPSKCHVPIGIAVALVSIPVAARNGVASTVRVCRATVDPDVLVVDATGVRVVVDDCVPLVDVAPDPVRVARPPFPIPVVARRVRHRPPSIVRATMPFGGARFGLHDWLPSRPILFRVGPVSESLAIVEEFGNIIIMFVGGR